MSLLDYALNYSQSYILMKLRRIMDSIHYLGNIYYDEGRFEGYKTVAVIASNIRKERGL